MQHKDENLDFNNIVHRLGVPVRLEDLRIAYKFDSDIKDIDEFEDEIEKAAKGNDDFEKIAEVIIQNEEIFDKDIYVLHIARLLDREIEREDEIRERLQKSGIEIDSLIIEKLFNNDENISSVILNKLLSKGVDFKIACRELSIIMEKAHSSVWIPPQNQKTKKSLLLMSKKYLNDVDILELAFSKNNGVEVISSQEFIGNRRFFRKKDIEGQKRLQEIEDTVGLETVLNYLKPSDLLDFCRYPNLGNILAANLFKDVNTFESQVNVQDRVNNSSQVYDSAEELPEGSNTFLWDEFIQTVRDNIKYIDIDKMLLLSNEVFLSKYGTEYENFTEEEMQELNDYTIKVEKLLENKNLSMNSRNLGRDINFQTIKSQVDTLRRSFLNGRFCTETEINEIAEDIIYGRRDIDWVTEQEFEDTLCFDTAEIGLIIKYNPKAIEHLLENEFIDYDKLLEILELQKDLTDEQLEYLCGNDEIEQKDLLDLYYKGKVSLDNIRHVKDTLEDEDYLNELVSTEKLVELYLDEDKKEEFDKYRKLYKVIRIDEKSLEEKDDISIEILDQSLELLKDEKIIELYHMGLVSLDTMIDFIRRPDLLKDLYLSGALKPVDAQRLYGSGKITGDMIKEVLVDPSIEEGQKLVLIYSTFPNLEDTKIREEMMEFMKEPTNDFFEKTKKTKKKEDKTTRISKEEQKLQSISKRYDPCAKWKLITGIDEEYSQRYLKDGYAIFYLPNQGKYILEKLYEAQNRPAFGAATYILDEDVYRKNEDEIIKSEKIDRTYLSKIKKEQSKGVKKIIHTGWGNAICKYFDIETSKKYTDKQKNEIKKLADEVEFSKKPLNEEIYDL